MFGIIILIFGVPGCFLGGWLDDKLGPKRTLVAFVIGITLAMTTILSIGDGKVAFVLEVPFPTPDDGLFASQAELFMVGAAALLGICAGPVQSSSRALIAVLAPEGQAGKYFGLFALSGKATSFAAPLGIGILLGVAGDRWAYSIILVFLIVGLLLLLGVREDKEAA